MRKHVGLADLNHGYTVAARLQVVNAVVLSAAGWLRLSSKLSLLWHPDPSRGLRRVKPEGVAVPRFGARSSGGVARGDRASCGGFKRNKKSKQNPPKLVGIGTASPLGQGGREDHGDQLRPLICDVVTGTVPSSPLEARFAIPRQP